MLPLGDIQYDSPSASNLKAVYDRTWGRVKSISRPVLGNHDGSGGSYFDYFNGPGRGKGRAGRPRIGAPVAGSGHSWEEARSLMDGRALEWS